MSAIFAAALADFRQRVRSFRFLAVMMATVAVALLMLPTQDAGYVVLQVGEGRGAYGAAWVGLVFGVVGSLILPLFGFFIVKDAVQRDRQTRVGALLAATPLGPRSYLAAKLLSNVGTFVAILAVCTVMAFAMQWWRAEDRALHPIDLLVHLWAVPMPMILLTSTLALLFECVPGLRGAFGNVVFFFLWVGMLGPGLARMESDAGRIVARQSDIFGISEPLADFEDRLNLVAPGHGRGVSIGANIGAKPPQVIAWPGVAGNIGWLGERLAWCLAFLPVLFGAALFFDRFDPARGRRGEPAPPKEDVDANGVESRPWRALTGLPRGAAAFRPFALLRAELALLVKRRAWWWYGVVGGLWIAGLANGVDAGARFIVPIAWLWAITAFSELGARAQIHRTHPLLDSCAAPLARQVPLQWLAGTLLAVLLAAPVVLKALAVDPGLAAQIVVGGAFVAALALAAGAVSGGARMFELVFLMLWYAAIQSVPGVAFGGQADVAFMASDAPHLAAWAVGLFALATGLRALRLRT